MASTMEALLMAQVNLALNPPTATMQDTGTHTTTFTTAGTPVKVTLGTVVRDTYSGWSAANNLYTAQVPGVYEMQGAIVVVTASSATYAIAELFYNGSALADSTGQSSMYANSVAGGFIAETHPCQWYLNAGDTIGLYGQFGVASIQTQSTSSLDIRFVHQ